MKHFLYVEKYRPQTIAECILPAALKAELQALIDKGEKSPNLLFFGGPGIGKTTAARAMIEEWGGELLFINGSLDGNIDTLRNDIRNFATTKSFSGKRKFVLIDEADHLNPQSTQPALRSFMEQFSGNCGFILTANYPNKIIEPLQSRCGGGIDFAIPALDRPALAMQITKMLTNVLETEGIQYNMSVIRQVVLEMFPDIRKMLNVLQRHAAKGSITTNVLADDVEDAFDRLWEIVVSKDWKAGRSWAAENAAMPASTFYRKFLDSATIPDNAKPNLYVIVGRYMQAHSFMADPEIAYACCITEVILSQ